jgi:hypothetical protein
VPSGRAQVGADRGSLSFWSRHGLRLPASDALTTPSAGQARAASHAGYRINALPDSEDAPDLIVLVAFPGRGKRSASFGYGALKGMREVMIETQRGRGRC